MENIIILLLCMWTSTIDCQVSLTPGQTCDKFGGSLCPLVVGGCDTAAEDAPWHTVLELITKAKSDRIVNHCGGNILSPTIILTAAHCVWQNGPTCPEHIWKQESAEECHELPGGCPAECTRVRPEDLNVYVGVTSIRQTDRFPLKVKNIILHPGWDISRSVEDTLRNGHDLAIIVLKTKLKFNSKVRHICLPDDQHRLRSRQYVILNGLGYTDGFGERPAQRLQHGRLQIIAKEECTADYDQGQILGDQLCAYSADTGSCHGDSGSGLVKIMGSIPVLVGTVSFGHRLCKYRPGVYANIQSHMGWIQQKMIDISAKPDCSCSDFINKYGFGQCKKGESKIFGGSPYCYVNNPSTCSDLLKSFTNPGKWRSAEACKQKSDCSCSDFINKYGFGQCKKGNSKIFLGSPYCYVNNPSTCSDLLKSFTDPGKWRSAEACQPK